MLDKVPLPELAGRRVLIKMVWQEAHSCWRKFGSLCSESSGRIKYLGSTQCKSQRAQAVLTM